MSKEEDDDATDKKEEENDLKKHVKEELRKLLVKSSGQTVIAFPKFHVETYPEEIIAHFTFIDIISPFAYFVKPEKETRDKNKNEPENKVDAQTEMECASRALKEQKCTGYEFCKEGDEPAYCDLLNDKMLGLNRTNEEIKKCVIREKVDIAKAEEFIYQTTNEKIETIQTAAKEKKLTLESHKGEYLPFEQLHRIAEESEIDRSKLFSRTNKHHKISDKKSKLLKLEDGITSLQSCFEACVDPKNEMTCDSFSFCKRFDSILYDCNIAELNRKQADEDFNEYFEEDENCHVFTVSALKHFQSHEGMRLNDESPLDTFAATDSAECAQDCLNRNQEKQGEEQCLSIEVCTDGEKSHCRLSREQTLWKGSDDKNLLIPEETCNVHSVKHLLNFHTTTKEKLQNFLKETVDSIDQCATLCDIGQCKQFNYCENQDRKECRYLSEIVSGDKHNTERQSEEIGCTSYIRRDEFVKPPEVVKEEEIESRPSGKGFKRGSVTGLVFLFLFIGLFVGAGGLYAKKRFLGGGGESDGGENATITFSNLNRETDD